MTLSVEALTLLEFLRTRRSVRRFVSKPVPDEVLRRVLETATWAPSAHHRQPWRFAVLASRATRTRLGEAMGSAFFRDLIADGNSPEVAERLVDRSRTRIESAPVAVVLCLDPSALDRYPDEARERNELVMGIQSVALAGGNLLLAAHAEGLGGVWVCAPLFAQDVVVRVLELPAHWLPQGMILLGYPRDIPAPRPRLPLDEVTRYIR